MNNSHVIRASLKSMAQNNQHLLFWVLKLWKFDTFFGEKLLLLWLITVRFLCCVGLWFLRWVVCIVIWFHCSFLWVVIIFLIFLYKLLLFFNLFHPHGLRNFIEYKLMVLIIEPGYIFTGIFGKLYVFISHFFSNFFVLFHDILHIFITFICNCFEYSFTILLFNILNVLLFHFLDVESIIIDIIYELL